jgi:dihydrofolate reductase
MGKIVCDISMSLDGYIAGPNPTLEEPLGHGGEELHKWVYNLKSWREPHGMTGGETGQDNDIMKESTENIGAVIMGRRMFSGGEGPWESDPNPDAWWGSTPPFHVPVFILTNHKREKVEKKGGTSFNFITDGIESALSQAKGAAEDKNISIAGGANTIQQFIKARYLNEIQIHIAPILLGGGTPLLANLSHINLKKMRVIDSPYVTHIKFQILY